MDEELTSIDTAPADTSADDGADIGQTMEAVYDAHNPEDSEPSEYVSSNEAHTESFANTEQPADTIETPTSLQMPQAWSKEQAAVWNGLTPDAQRYIADRERQAQQKISELGHLAKHGDIGQAFESYKAQGLVPHGEDGQPLSAQGVIESALSFDQALRQNPSEAISALARSHNVDLAALAGVQGPSGHSPDVVEAAIALSEALERDPEGTIAALSHSRGLPDPYTRAQTELQQRLDQQQQQQHAARYQWMASELEKFTTGKEWWSTVEDEVIRQVAVVRDMDPTRLQTDPLSVLKEAEQRALRIKNIDPDAKTKATEAKKKADDAKRLASLNVGRNSGGRAVSTGQTWQETMTAAYDTATGYRGYRR
jgi:hypothetical protein